MLPALQAEKALLVQEDGQPPIPWQDSDSTLELKWVNGQQVRSDQQPGAGSWEARAGYWF
eukprot:SAG22_NODE_7764_length_710_cov_1.055646_1_plen_60_part_00